MSATLKEIALLFLKLGTLGFGGPAAHIAMMEDEVVTRRRWISQDEFLDLLGVTNLIPGPNSTEMAIHIGLRRGGWKGLVVAGACFILPAVLITLLFAHLYTAYGSTPQAGPLIAGIHAGVLAVIAAAVIRIGKPLLKKSFMILLGSMALALNLFGFDEILILFGAGAVGFLWKYTQRTGGNRLTFLLPLSALNIPSLISWLGTGVAAGGATLSGLGFYFLKIGFVLYGSGYVLFAFLESGLVDARQWITQSQLLDAIAVGQVTPGPILSSATFLGYVLMGFPGAVVATTGIFLPSFLLVLAVSPLVPKLRSSALAGGFLDGVTAASLGLMLAVTIVLASTALTNVVSWSIFILAGLGIVFRNLNVLWIVAGSALIGWITGLG
ncbi:MAG: chromate efflux transporter [Bacteroidota bacterium]